MARIRKSNRKWQLIIGSVLFFLLVAGTGLLYVTKIEGSQENPPANGKPGDSATATPSPTPTPEPQATVGPIFTDEFNDNSKGWYTGKVADYTRVIEDDTLTLGATNHKILVESLPTDTPISDFALTTTFTLKKADPNDRVGVYIRGDSNLDHDYRIDIFGNSTYAISKEVLDPKTKTLQSVPLAGPVYSADLRPPGKQNMLDIIMVGPNLSLTINGVVTVVVTDPDYEQGQIALFVANGSTSDGVEASFDRIEINPPPERLPDPPPNNPVRDALSVPFLAKNV